MNRPQYEKYLKNTLTLEDGVLRSDAFDKDHIHIMSDSETQIMKRSAEIVAYSGGKILNIGFGMGIIDGFIRDLKPKSHDIIEAHPGIVQYAHDLGFSETAQIHHGDWRDVIEEFKEQGIKFDGIYFDTIILDNGVNEWEDFVKEFDSILNKGGTFSYFNNVAASQSPTLPQMIINQGYDMYYEVIENNDPNAELFPGNRNVLIWYLKK